MGNWMKIHCPGCKQKKDVPPGTKYLICDKCGTPHCGYCGGGSCKVQGCGGWLRDAKNPD